MCRADSGAGSGLPLLQVGMAGAVWAVCGRAGHSSPAPGPSVPSPSCSPSPVLAALCCSTASSARSCRGHPPPPWGPCRGCSTSSVSVPSEWLNAGPEVATGLPGGHPWESQESVVSSGASRAESPLCRSGVMLVGGRSRGSHLWSFPLELFGRILPPLSLPGAGLEGQRFIFLHFPPGLRLLEGPCEGAGGCVSPRGWSLSQGEEPFPGRGWLFHTGHFLSCCVPCAGRDPAAGADGKSGQGNRTVLSGLWGLAPPRRGWDRESRAGVRWEWGARVSPQGFSWEFSAHRAGDRADVCAGQRELIPGVIPSSRAAEILGVGGLLLPQQLSGELGTASCPGQGHFSVQEPCVALG